jgi:hypothetical protein
VMNIGLIVSAKKKTETFFVCERECQMLKTLCISKVSSKII